MIIKVCGMRHPSNINDVLNLGIDMMGFIFYPPSPRYVLKESEENPSSTSQDLSFFNDNKPNDNTNSCNKVGVFVNEEPQSIIHKAKKYNLDYIQLHGKESIETCKQLKDAGLHIIKVFSISSMHDISGIESGYHDLTDYFLFDTKCSGYGGSGKRFDWKILEAYNSPTPFLLSGGIDETCLKDIKEINHPQFAGVDLNSGFETEPAIKDITRLRSFISELRKN